HSDRVKDDKMSAATFVLTNIIPQAPKLNRGIWNVLEIYCRHLVEKEGKTLYIVAGPAGRGGGGSNGFRLSLPSKDDPKITVPAKCWKVILVLDADDEKVDEHTRIISVVMPNAQQLQERWGEYRVSLDQVERLTGFKFFAKAFKDLDKEVVKSL